MTDESTAQRPIPVQSTSTEPFWTAGVDGVLRLQRCRDCERYVHPPGLRCPHDHGELEFVAVSGRGLVESWTENYHPWFPGFPTPYVIAFVNPVEDRRVRLLTNLIGINASDVTPSMPVRVTFERVGDGKHRVFVPLFEPAPS